MSSPFRSTHYRNLSATAQNISNGACFVTKIAAYNTSAGDAYVQVFDSQSADVTLGTTRPLFEIPLVATTGFQCLEFGDPGLKFDTRFISYATTQSEGSSAAAAGVHLQSFIN